MINNDKIFWFAGIIPLFLNIGLLFAGAYSSDTGNIVQVVIYSILVAFAIPKIFCSNKSKYAKWLHSKNLFKIE